MLAFGCSVLLYLFLLVTCVMGFCCLFGVMVFAWLFDVFGFSVSLCCEFGCLFCWMSLIVLIWFFMMRFCFGFGC